MSFTEDQLIEQPAICFFGRTLAAQGFIRRAFDLLLPRLLSGQIDLAMAEEMI
jgi:hypothetical protein